jgi:hypothetical protein
MLLTLGGFGLWMIFDTVLVSCSEYTDSEGRLVVFARSGETIWKWLAALSSICISLLVSILMMGFVILLLIPQDGVTRTVNEQLTAIRNGNIDKAYSYGSDAFHQATSLDVFTEFVNGYDAIKNNKGITVQSHEIDHDGGELVGIVYSKNESLAIYYKLIFEDGKYKIQNIDVSPEAVNSDTALNDKQASTKGYLTYTDSVGNYSIQYPDTWYHESDNKYSLIFSGKKGSPDYISTVTVQVIPMQKLGGIYTSAQDVVDDLKGQIKADAKNAKFEKDGEAELATNPKQFKGLYFIVSYMYKDIPMRKMQFIIISPDKKYAYSWGYTTTKERYGEDLPIAKAMYESWDIK